MSIFKEKHSYDAIGLVGTPATLTATYAGNVSSGILARYMPNIHLDFKYTPKSGQTDRYLYILLEGSNDGGTTYFPMSVKSSASSEIDVFTKDTDGNQGIPVIFPGDKLSTGAVVYSGQLDTTMALDFVRVSVKETGSANFGTAYVRVTVAS